MKPETDCANDDKFRRYFLMGVFIASFVLFVSVIRHFVVQIILAAIISILVYPLYERLVKATKNSRGLAAFLCCTVIIIAIFLPLIIIVNLAVAQGVELYQTLGNRFNSLTQPGDFSIMGKLADSPVGRWLNAQHITIDWRAVFERFFLFMGSFMPKLVNTASRITVDLIVQLFIVMFSLFYFLRDGKRMLLKIKDVIPLRIKDKERIIARFQSISNVTVKGIILIALLQSFFATITLMAFGFKAWLLWGGIMVVLSVIPFVGTGIVLIPAGIIKIASGDITQGIAIILISVFFISLIDNFLRPRIVGQQAGMHDLIVFFSIIGGIFSFGPAGFIIGPIGAALLLTVLDMYREEFFKK